MATVLIGADICPIEGNTRFFQSGDASSLFHDLLPEFNAADLSIANLECPLIERPTPISKTGPIFGESGSCINGIKAAGIDLLGLANNHIMDHGATGLRNTMRVCTEAGVAIVGAGEDLAAAQKFFVRQIGNIRIAVLAFAEHEFSIAAKNSWGANPLDLIAFIRNVKARRKDFDYLIVLLHGGHEFHVPSPRVQETCRFMVEMGANAVIVQHPHLLGGYEEYLGGYIVYGQGALVMDEALYRNSESFHEGYLVKLLIADDASATMEIVPFIQSNPLPGARKMPAERENQFRRALRKRSDSIKEEGFVEEEWLRFCDQQKHGYIGGLLAHNRVIRKLNRNGLLTKFLHGKRPLLGARNTVCCETHREAIETIFKHNLLK